MNGGGSEDKKPNAGKAVEFLRRLWIYSSLDARCFALVWICGEKLQYRHYCFDEVKSVKRESKNHIKVRDYPSLWGALEVDLQELLRSAAEKGCHVYFQVLPLSERPKRGRGSAADVKVGRWLWADLDFKETVERPEFEGCREGEDYELECFYREGDKWIHVRRPKLSEVLARIRETLGAEPTIVVDSGNGYHLYFELEDEAEASAIRAVEEKLVDLLGADKQSKDLARILRLPGSVNPRNGRVARVILDTGNRVSLEELKKGLEEIEAEKKSRKRAEKIEVEDVEEPVVSRRLRELRSEEIFELVNTLKGVYEPGVRQSIWLYLSGWMAKAGIHPLSCIEVLMRLYRETGDQDPLKTRLSAVVYSYKKAGIDVDSFAEDIERLTGVKPYGLEKEIKEEPVKGRSGLEEVIERVLEERGLPEEKVAEKVTEIITRIQSVIGSPGPGSRTKCIEWKGRTCRKAVKTGKRGAYLVKWDSDGEPTTKVISTAVISEAKKIRIKGLNLDLEEIYSVRVGDLEIIGTLGEILSEIESKFGVESGSKFALQYYIANLAEEAEERFYSPGPWVVEEDGRKIIVFAERGGYLPPWKDDLEWSPPKKPADPEQVKRALTAIRNLVLSYRDPSKPSLVLSYGVIAAVAEYIKIVLGIFPHLVVYGSEDTGKTLLIEVLRILYGIQHWNEPFPGSDFQARKLLAQSTLPALIDELHQLRDAFLSGDKNAVDVLNVLHRAATQTVLRVSGGHQYAGYYLAIRSVIAAMNGDASLLPWQQDKFILVKIGRFEGIDLAKAYGYTPRTMPAEVRAALPYVFVELLRALEEMLPEVEKLRGSSRIEVIKSLVKLGYEAWRRVYSKYGLEPFPEPAEPEIEARKADARAEYWDVLVSYVLRCIDASLSKPANCSIQAFEEREIEESEYALRKLNEDEAIAVKRVVEGPDGDRRDVIAEVIMKKTFLSKFLRWVEKEYGLQNIGRESLAELLGLRETRMKIGGRIVGHLYRLNLLERSEEEAETENKSQ